MRRWLHSFRPLLWGGVALAGYALIGFLLLPYLIQAYGVPYAAEKLGHPVFVREVAVNPLTLSLRLGGLEVRDQHQAPIIGCEELFVNLHGTTLFLRTIGFDEIRLVMPYVAVHIDRQGRLNLLDLVPPADKDAQRPTSSEAAKTTPSMPIVIDDLRIDRGIVEFRDESKPTPVAVDVVPVQIALRNFSTVTGGENAYAFTAEIGKGEEVAWQGTISLDPLESDGKLSLTGIQVRTLYQAVQDRFQFDVRQGELTVSGVYHVDLTGGQSHALVQNGALALRNLVLGERGLEDRLVEIPALDMDDIGVDLAKRSVTIGKIASSDARFAVWIDPDGLLNYQRLARGQDHGAAGPATGPAAPRPASAPDWSLDVHELALHNYGATFEDRTLPRPSHLEVSGVNLTVKEVAIPFTRPVPVDLALTLNRSGHVRVNGIVAREPLSAQLDVAIRQVAIRPFQPYLDRFLNADVRDGSVELTGRVRFGREREKGPLLRFQGHLAVDRFFLTDRTDFQDVAAWKSLAVNKLELEVEPTSVKAEEIVWQEPVAHVAIDPDGTLNVSRLLIPSDRSPRPSDPDRGSGKPAPPVAVTVHTVKLIKGGSLFHDRSIEPSVRAAISELTGTIRGLSSKDLAKATVALAGKVGAGAPLKVEGQINPLTEDAYTDLTLRFDNVDLTTASPYAGKYAGYPIVNGTLFLDLTYKIAKKELVGENKVLIDQLAFGDKTNSPDATALPVPLAAALLKDRKGQIDIDLPVRGNLNDPDFKYGRVVLNAVLNLLAKAATSPLSLLGALVGGAEDELRAIAFAPGLAGLGAAEVGKLATLGNVLVERPGLFLEITATADPTKDRRALAEAKLRARLAEMRGNVGADGAHAPMSPEEETRLIDAWYAALPDHSVAAEASEEKRARLLATLPVSDEELLALAEERAQAIRAKLMESGSIAPDRIVIKDVRLKEAQQAVGSADLTLAGRS